MKVKREGEHLYYKEEVIDLIKDKMQELGDFTRQDIVLYVRTLKTELNNTALNNLVTNTIKSMIENKKVMLVNGKGYTVSPQPKDIINDININVSKIIREIKRTINTGEIDVSKLVDNDLQYLSSLEVKLIQLEKLVDDYRRSS